MIWRRRGRRCALYGRETHDPVYGFGERLAFWGARVKPTRSGWGTGYRLTGSRRRQRKCARLVEKGERLGEEMIDRGYGDSDRAKFVTDEERCRSRADADGGEFVGCCVVWGFEEEQQVGR